MTELLKDEFVAVRVEAGTFFALNDLKKLCGKSVSSMLRDLMAEAIQARMLSDTEHPVAPMLVKRYPGLGIFELYRDFVSAQQGLPGFQFIESIKFGGVQRYIIATPGHVVPAGKDYWQGIGEMLMRGGLPEKDVPGAIEQLKVRMQKTTEEIEAKNKARKAKLREENPDKAKAADEFFQDPEKAMEADKVKRAAQIAEAEAEVKRTAEETE